MHSILIQHVRRAAAAPFTAPLALALSIGLATRIASAAQPPAAPPPVAPPASAPNAATLKEPVVTLLEPGAEPRQTLRLKVAKGETTDLDLLVNTKMNMSVNGEAVPEMTMPAIHTIARMTVTDIRPEGDLAYDFVYREISAVEDPAVPPEVLAQVRNVLASMKGTHGSGVFNNRAMPREFKMSLPADADPLAHMQVERMAHALAQMAAPLPAEPVGVGARWLVETESTVTGIKSKVANEVMLKQIEGGVITLAIVISESAEPQDVSDPQLPAGTTLHVNVVTSTGSATSVVDLSQLATDRAQSHITTDSDMTIRFSDGTPERKMTQHMELTITLSEPLPLGQEPAAPGESPRRP